MRTNGYPWLLIVMLAACAFPKTTEEYRAAAREGRGTTRIEKIEVALPYKKVLANLQTYSDKCLNADARVGPLGYGRAHFNKHGEAEIHSVGKNQAELFMTINGNYWLVTDLVAQRADRTTLTIYTHWKPYIEEVSGWAHGNAPGCNN
jgi:hypothetical protein